MLWHSEKTSEACQFFWNECPCPPAEHNHIHDTTYIVTLIDIIQQNLRALIVNVNVQCAMLKATKNKIFLTLRRNRYNRNRCIFKAVERAPINNNMAGALESWKRTTISMVTRTRDEPSNSRREELHREGSARIMSDGLYRVSTSNIMNNAVVNENRNNSTTYIKDDDICIEEEGVQQQQQQINYDNCNDNAAALLVMLYLLFISTLSLK